MFSRIWLKDFSSRAISRTYRHAMMEAAIAIDIVASDATMTIFDPVLIFILNNEPQMKDGGAVGIHGREKRREFLFLLSIRVNLCPSVVDAFLCSSRCLGGERFGALPYEPLLGQ